MQLAREGQGFFDLRRLAWTGPGGTQADSAIPAYVLVEKTRRSFLSAAVWQTRHHLYPIPNIQIQLSKVGTTTPLQQNPGWEPAAPSGAGRLPAPDQKCLHGTPAIRYEH